MRKVEELNNYGKSLATILQNIPDDLLRKNRTESMRFIRKELGFIKFFKLLLVPFPVSEFRRFHVFRPLSFESDDTISNSQG